MLGRVGAPIRHSAQDSRAPRMADAARASPATMGAVARSLIDTIVAHPATGPLAPECRRAARAQVLANDANKTLARCFRCRPSAASPSIATNPRHTRRAVCTRRARTTRRWPGLDGATTASTRKYILWTEMWVMTGHTMWGRRSPMHQLILTTLLHPPRFPLPRASRRGHPRAPPPPPPSPTRPP